MNRWMDVQTVIQWWRWREANRHCDILKTLFLMNHSQTHFSDLSPRSSIHLCVCLRVPSSIHSSVLPSISWLMLRSIDPCLDNFITHHPHHPSTTFSLSLPPVLSSLIYIYVSLIFIFFFHPLPIFLNFFSIPPFHISISTFFCLCHSSFITPSSHIFQTC